jgi:hypothetical protein
MTPTHERLIDELLQQFFRRADEQIRRCGLQINQPPPLEKLRTSTIGQHLSVLAQYAEGYNFSPSKDWRDVRDSIAEVQRAFFGHPLTKTYQLPPQFHLTPLGQLINDAMVRFYRQQGPSQLVAIGALRERFQVRRQTIHQWVARGLITPVYVNGETRFFLPDVERLQLQLQQPQRKRKVKEKFHPSETASMDG